MNINEKSLKECTSKSKQIASDMPKAASDKHHTAPAIPRGFGRVTKKSKPQTAWTFLSRAPVMGTAVRAKRAHRKPAAASRSK